MTESASKPSFIASVFRMLGPGFITGAADDDPSGVVTYSLAGAQSGTAMLWTTWITWPLMAAVQMMCARIGMVTGRGLAYSMCKKFSRHVVALFCIALLFANSITIAADLAGMADAANLLSGLDADVYIIVFGLGISYAVIRFPYSRIANVLKWLALSLLAYIITAFTLHPDWFLILQHTFSITRPQNSDAWKMLVALFGTTISPNLFFWQSAQEVEEENKDIEGASCANKEDLSHRFWDVSIGTFFSNVVMFFIMLTTALTLHAHGLVHITSSKEVAEVLQPLAGKLAMLLYTSGIVAVGLLAIPTLAGSTAYAFAEMFQWDQGLNHTFGQAPAFYGIIILSMLCGMLLNFLHINPVQAMYWSSLINGIFTPFILVGVLAVARDSDVMLGQPSSIFSQIMVGITILLMLLAAMGILFV